MAALSVSPELTSFWPYRSVSDPNFATSWRPSPMPFEVFMWSWDEISGRKVLATVPTMQEADDKLDELSERFPHAYIDYRGVPE
tara:strand:- start:197 stop:448 length:252 start_codon:yes stop_codon:yes gene_type:complete